MKLLASLLLLFSINSHAGDIDWSQNPYDKASHIAIGGVLSCAIGAATKNPWWGLLAATTVGLLKESVYDQNFDKADAVSWAVGGAVGMICVEF